MRFQKVEDYHVMSVVGADIIYRAVSSTLKQGKNFKNTLQ